MMKSPQMNHEICSVAITAKDQSSPVRSFLFVVLISVPVSMLQCMIFARVFLFALLPAERFLNLATGTNVVIQPAQAGG
jgi:hypothetical protein